MVFDGFRPAPGTRVGCAHSGAFTSSPPSITGRLSCKGPWASITAKVVMQVLEPIDVAAEFGEEPDIDEVDAHIRRVMQKALDTLAKERRFPMIG
jgi:hypothetical protein